eukprot:6210145-Pleurochrysis_carterae.AAC.4
MGREAPLRRMLRRFRRPAAARLDRRLVWRVSALAGTHGGAGGEGGGERAAELARRLGEARDCLLRFKLVARTAQPKRSSTAYEPLTTARAAGASSVRLG